VTDCPIFSTYLAASRIDMEIDALVEDFESQISSGKDKRFSVKEGEWHEADDNNFAGYRYVTRRSMLTIRGLGRGRSSTRSLSLHFDLVRDITGGSVLWPHAREALLVIAYASERGDWWEPESLCVASSGRLEDDETWDKWCAGASVENKFLVWSDTGAKSDFSKVDVSDQDWLFAVPLRLINDSNAIKNMFVNPVCSLLLREHPETALSGSQPIQWNVASS
jgi:hypothetical protein